MDVGHRGGHCNQLRVCRPLLNDQSVELKLAQFELLKRVEKPIHLSRDNRHFKCIVSCYR